ncbi:hypothetical protein BDV10DRAFT_8067 [Aspergillus recurvatus]
MRSSGQASYASETPSDLSTGYRELIACPESCPLCQLVGLLNATINIIGFLSISFFSKNHFAQPP